jgi:hypothetical protein
LEFWNITKFHETKIGINTEQVETHQNAANYSPFVSIDENFKAVEGRTYLQNICNP